MRLEMKTLLAILLIAVSLSALAPQTARANDMSKQLGELNYVVERDELQGLLAKELCSCRYVEGLSLQECKDRMPLPAAAFMLMSANEVPEQHMIYVNASIISNMQAQATFNVKSPRKGCRMTYGRLNYP
jgi:hypothetical protein